MVSMTKWDTFYARWPNLFRQGDHVTVIGPTGSGKTVLTRELVKPRGYVVVTGVKLKDESLSVLSRQGWQRVNRWKERKPYHTRLLLWPNVTKMDKVVSTHKSVFTELMESVYVEGAWCIWLDEMRYLSEHVGLRNKIILLYITGRSNGISVVGSAQRPSHVPLEAYSQAQHLFMFRTGDERDLVRMGGLNGVNAKQVAATVASLPEHHFLYVNMRTGEQVISTVH